MVDTGAPNVSTNDAPPPAAEAQGLVDGTEDAITREAIDAALAEEAAASGSASATEATTEEAPTVKERPANIPEKFWDAEKGEARWDALADAYSELERKQSTAPKTGEEAAEAVAEVVDANALTAEFADKGELSEASRTSLTKALSKALGGDDAAAQTVALYEAGLKALAAQMVSDVKGIAGGDEGYAQMSEWAKTNLSADEIKKFDTEVLSNDPTRAKAAVRDLHLRFREAGGAESIPSLVGGKANTGGKAGDAYANQDELYNDIADPRYDKDPAFRARVDAKIARSV